VPEFIDPVFPKTSPKRSFSVIQNERFGLVFAKTGSIISGIGIIQVQKVLDSAERKAIVKIYCQFPAQMELPSAPLSL